MPISFKYRFIISFVILETFFILMIVSLNFFSLEGSTKQTIKDKKESSIALMKELVKTPMLVYDLATLDDVSKTLTTLNNINSAFIFDAKHRLLSFNNQLKEFVSPYDFISHKNNEVKKLTINDKPYDIVYAPIVFDETTIGYVYIIFDFADISSLVQENRQYTITLIIIEILLSSLLAYFLGMRLTRKLNFLTTVTKDIAQNKKVDIPRANDRSELGALSNSINEMQYQIFQRNTRLQQFKLIFEKILEGVVILDKNTTITYVNPSFCDITGYTPKEILGQKISVLKSGKHDKRFYKKMWNEINQKQYWNGKIVNKRKNGDLYDERLSISVIEGSENETIYVGIFSDITEQLKYDQLMKEKEKVYHQQAKMASMGEMLGNIAHQWRQPLNMISLTASSIKMGVETELYEKKEYLELTDQIISTTLYLSQTIDDFRHFFKQDKQKELTNIKKAIDTTLQLVLPALKNKGIRVHVDVKDSIEIVTFTNELKQVLVNIMNNARDVLLERDVENKLIMINVNVINGLVEFELFDNAGGIDDSIIGKVFEPYFTTKHQSQGTGIGLYMSEEIVCKHLDGELTVMNKEFKYEDKHYKGACFSIKLPLNT